MNKKNHAKVTDAEHFIFNSEKIAVTPNRKYKFCSQMTAQKGEKYTAYVAIIILNSDDQEISRYIRWISDFSGKPKEYSITFSTANESDSMIVGHRINTETPIKSEMEMSFPEFSPSMLSIVDVTVELDSDDRSDYIQPLFLKKIKEKINCGEYNSRNKTIDEINDELEKKQVRSVWKKGSAFESEHWRDYLVNKVEDYRLDPELPLSKELAELLKPVRNQEIKILDVGAGPLTTLGKVYPGHKVSLVAVDPLAEIYDRILSQINITPPIRTIYGEAENLCQEFSSNTFDIVYCANALDHCYNPFKAIQQMLVVLKPRGMIVMKHFLNEAENENYTGFHQWNLWSFENKFIIWNRNEFYNVNEVFKKNTSILASEKNSILTVFIHKR